MPNGTVKFFNAAKGFGFITADGAGKDIFVPSASVSASGIALKPGQRLAFEEVPDAKGPKAVNLQLLPEAPRPVAPRQEIRAPARAEPRLVFYHDHTSEWSEHVLEEIRALGHQPQVVSYREAPPTKDQLRALARLMQAGNQNLVRKYDPLFFELQLDDRFIGEGEFWDAIVEHPGLINGPLLATEAKASLLHADDDVPAFFRATPADTAAPAAKPKGLSPRALAILAGGPAAPRAEAPKPVPAEAVAPEPAKVVKLKLEVRPTAKPVVTAKAKPAAKPKAAAKPIKAVAKKPAKKR